jgi:DNA-binding response OmpR family regulator
MAVLLQMRGYEVFVAYGGKDALKAAIQHQPQVLLLDIGMPDMTGYELAREIRSQAWGIPS